MVWTKVYFTVYIYLWCWCGGRTIITPAVSKMCFLRGGEVGCVWGYVGGGEEAEAGGVPRGEEGTWGRTHRRCEGAGATVL